MNRKNYNVIFKNAAVLTVGRFISRILQFFLLIYAVRRLGVESFGIYSFAYVLVKICDRFMDIGISNYTVQQLSRDFKLTPRYLGASLITKIFFVIFGYALIMGIANIMGKDTLTIKVLSVLALNASFDSFSLPFNAIFRAHEKMKYQAVIILISNTLMTIIGFSVLLVSDNVLFYSIAITTGGFFRFIFSAFWCLKKFEKPNLDFDISFIKQLIRKSSPFVIGGIFVTMYYNIDTIFLDIFDGKEVVAYYNAAYRLVEGPLFISGAIRMAIFPAISRLYGKGAPELNTLISIFFYKGLALGLSIAIVISFLSEEIILALYGSDYSPTAQILSILIFSLAIIMPSTICGQSIKATDRQHVSAIVTGGGMIINIVLNFILIPKYSYLGAAWATLVTELVVVVAYTEIIRRYLGTVIHAKPLIQILFLSLLLLGFLFLTKPAGVLVQLIGYCFIFLPCTLVTGVFTMDDLKKVLAWKRRKAKLRKKRKPLKLF